MAALLAVFALGLLAYLPGRFLLRLLLPPGSDPPGGRLLLEVLLGNSAVGLCGFLLAELESFSLGGVLALLTIVTVAAAALGRRADPGSYSLVDAGGLALFVAGLLWVMPPFDTSLYGNDSSVYVAGGRSLARHGGLSFPDSSIEQIPSALRHEFFPSSGRVAGKPPFARVAGGLLVSDFDRPVVMPAFHHLLSVWVALAYDIAGEGALCAPGPFFGGVALWAIVVFAYGLAGGLTAMLTAGLLLLAAPQYWYSRFLMPEVASQYFLWAGLVAAGISTGPRSGWLGVAAGLGLGMSGLMRLDGLAHVLAALALCAAVAPTRAWPAGRGFLPALVLVSLYAVTHQVLFPTHYYSETLSILRLGFGRLRSWWGFLHASTLPGAAAAVLIAPAAARAGGRLLHAAVRLAAALLFLSYVAAALAEQSPDPGAALDWLTLYLGWPMLLAAIAGVALWVARAERPAERFALALALIVTAHLVYDPRVTPAPLWAIRRFVPVALPAILIAAALLVDTLGRWRRIAAAVAIGALVLGLGDRSSLAYRADAFAGSARYVRDLAALLPPDAVVLYDPTFAVQSQMHIAVWSAADVPAYLLASDMREPLQHLRLALGTRPVYWLGTDGERAAASLRDIGEPVASYRFVIPTRRLDWYDPRDDLGLRDITLWLYRLHPTDPGAALH